MSFLGDWAAGEDARGGVVVAVPSGFRPRALFAFASLLTAPAAGTARFCRRKSMEAALPDHFTVKTAQTSASGGART
jgi:hypothetical protein